VTVAATDLYNCIYFVILLHSFDIVSTQMLFSKYLGGLTKLRLCPSVRPSVLLQIPPHSAADRGILLWKSDNSVARILQFGQNKTQKVAGT